MSKVKSILKGLRYITQIFVGGSSSNNTAEEDDDEIQIGPPTDVKHVAHIGSDDAQQNAPSWMNEYKGTNPSETESGNTTEKPAENANSPKRKEKSSKVRHLIPRSKHDTADGDTTKKTRRHHRSADLSAESPVNDSSSGGSRHRRHRRGSNTGSESPSTEMPPSGTKAPRRRAKNSEDSSDKKRSNRSKGESLTDIDVGSGSIPESESGPK